MSRRSFATRRELEEHHFHPAVLIGIGLVTLFLHAYLPRIWKPFGLLDLPLILVVYLSISWRNPMYGTFTGALIGLLQDAPSNQYIGVNGIAKTLVGYTAASIGLKVDVDNVLTRVLMNFGFCLLQSIVLFFVQRFLLGESVYPLQWLHELLRAGVNAAVAVPLFYMLDLTRTDEML